MHRRMLCILAALLGLAQSGAKAAESAEQTWLREFAAAYDDGGLEAFQRFCALRWGPRPGCAEAAWNLRYRYGPARLRGESQEPLARVHWFESEITGGWFGIGWQPDARDPAKIGATLLVRGVRPSIAPPPVAVAEADLPAALAGYLEAAGGRDLFSGTILVAAGDRIVFQGAYGTADREAGRPLSPATPLRISSAAKMFTAAAVLSAVEQDRLALSAPLGSYLPEYPAKVSGKTTLRHLLTHTSGIELDEHRPFTAAADRSGTLKERVDAQIRYVRFLNDGRYRNFKPLDRFDYSNENFDLLGRVLERADGRRWTEVLQERVLGSAGAEIAFGPVPGRTALSYSTRGPDGAYTATVAAADPRLPSRAWPSGAAVYAGAEDLLRFMRWVAGRRARSGVFEEATRLQVAERDEHGVRTGYGYGFEIEEHGCFRSYGHTGGEDGASAVVRAYPDRDMTVIVLANRDAVARDVASALEGMIFGC